MRLVPLRVLGRLALQGLGLVLQPDDLALGGPDLLVECPLPAGVVAAGPLVARLADNLPKAVGHEMRA